MPNLIYGIFVSRSLKVPLFYAGDLRKVNSKLVSCTITSLPQNTLSRPSCTNNTTCKKEFFNMQHDQLDQTTALLVLGGATDEHPFTYRDLKKS